MTQKEPGGVAGGKPGKGGKKLSGAGKYLEGKLAKSKGETPEANIKDLSADARAQQWRKASQDRE